MVVVERGALDGGGGRSDTGEYATHVTAASSSCAPAITITRGIHARLSRHRGLQGQDRASAEWPEDLEYSRQEHGRDRERRNGGGAGTRDDGRGRAGDDAAALAVLHRGAPRKGSDRRRLIRELPEAPRIQDRALEDRACSPGTSTVYAVARAGVQEATHPRACPVPAHPRHRRRHALHCRATPPGISASVSCPMAIFSRRSAKARPRS